MKPWYKRSPWFELLFLLGCISLGGVLYWWGMAPPGKCPKGYTAVVVDNWEQTGYAKGFGFKHQIVLKDCIKNE